MNIDTESEIKSNIDFKLKDISFINEVTIQLNNETARNKYPHTVQLGKSIVVYRMCFVFI